MVGRVSLVAFAASALLFAGGGVASAQYDGIPFEQLVQVYVPDQAAVDSVVANYDAAEYKSVQDAIKPYVNVPLDQMTSFTDGVFDQTLVPEPPAHTQEVYGILDSVVQKVLTDENADIDSLLSDANDQAQALLG